MTTNSKLDFERDYKRNIKKIYLFKFFTSLHFFSGVLIPFFIGWGKLSFSQLMLLQAIFTFSVFLLEVPTGVVADKYGRKTSMVISVIFVIAAVLTYSITPNFWLFLIGEIFWAAGAALMSGSDSALIYDTLKLADAEKESKKVYARQGSIGLLGLLIAAPIGSLMAEYINVRSAVIFTSIPLAIAFIIGLTIKEPKNTHKKDEERNYWKILSNGAKYLKNHKALKNLMVDHLPTSILSFFIIWSYQVVLEGYNVPVKWFGIVHAALTIGQILLLRNIVFIEKIFGGKEKYLKITPFIIAISFVAIAIFDNLWISIASIILIATFGLTRRQIFKNYFNKHIESKNRATIISFISMIYSLGQAISNFVLGKALEINLNNTLIIVGALILVSRIKCRLQEHYLLD